MPLAFESLSHGPVAFGFFNVDTDLLLLERYFFFADFFCSRIEQLARLESGEAVEENWAIREIPDPEEVGDLMGAIHGVRFTGFIGQVYRHFPFPDRPAEFRQKPEGSRNRDLLLALLKRRALPVSVPFCVAAGGRRAAIGRYGFSRQVFQELVGYVWRGGYPRWREGIRPEYVSAMKERVAGSANPLLQGMVFGP